MTQPTIWHHRRCSKSRQTLSLLQERGLNPNIVIYTDTPPNQDELRHTLAMLDLSPRQLMRTNEKVYKEQGLANVADDDALIEAMVRNPILIQRPIVFFQGKAAIGRPPEQVLALFE